MSDQLEEHPEIVRQFEEAMKGSFRWWACPWWPHALLDLNRVKPEMVKALEELGVTTGELIDDSASTLLYELTPLGVAVGIEGAELETDLPALAWMHRLAVSDDELFMAALYTLADYEGDDIEGDTRWPLHRYENLGAAVVTASPDSQLVYITDLDRGRYVGVHRSQVVREWPPEDLPPVLYRAGEL